MKPLCVCLLVGPYCLASAQIAPNPRVTYTTVAVPIQKALEDISRKSKVKLVVSEELQNEPIILRLTDVPLDVARKHIASATAAEWRKLDDGSLELWRSPETMEEIQSQLIEQRATVIRKAIQKKLDQKSSYGDFTNARANTLATQWARIMSGDMQHRTNEDESRRHQLAEQFPDQRALWKIVSQVDPRLIASVKRGWQRTFSTNPSKTQGSLPFSLVDAVPDWRDEHNLLAAELQSALAGTELREFGGAEGDARSPMPSRPTRLDLRVRPSLTSPQIDFDLLAFDGQNRPIATVASQIIEIDEDEVQRNSREFLESDKSKTLTRVVPVSAVTQLYVDYETSLRSGNDVKAAAGALRTALLDPENNEPLASFVSDALIGESVIRHSNLAACPDDDLFNMVYVLADNRFRASVLRQTLTGFARLTGNRYSEADGWIEMSPLDPELTATNRCNRAALGNYLKAIDSKGYIALDDTSRYAASIDGRFFPNITKQIMSMLFVPADLSVGEDSVDLFKFYGTLEADQLMRMSQGTPLRVAELKDDQLTPIEDLVYQTRYVSDHGFRNEDHVPTPCEFAALEEATEQFPDGLASDATILFNSVKEEDTFWVTIERMGYKTAQPFSIGQLASLIVRSEDATVQAEDQIKVVSVATGLHRQFEFHLDAAGGYYRSGKLQETVKTSKDMALDELPNNIKNQLDQLVDLFRREMHSRTSTPSVASPPLRLG